ncbi:hypothetical protein KCU95_g11437, partial [Aureobasidium melanogenum]
MSEITTSSTEALHTELIPEESSIQSSEAAKQLDSWRFTVRAGILVSILVALTNLGCLTWASTLHTDEGSATVFEGSCTEMKRITFWVDLAINILSTLLLGASNNCAQLLVAPTRKDIDDAHAAGRYLDVGVSSLRNIRAVSRWRQWLCACLFLSSVPLHLLYNSVVFSTLSASNYMAAVVTNDFLEGAAWNTSTLGFIETDATGQRQLARLQNNTDRLKKLDDEDCIRAYGTNLLESDWKNVLVVSNANVTAPLITAYYHRADKLIDDLGWICGSPGSNTCDTKSMLSHPQDWTITDLLYQTEYGSYSLGYMRSPVGPWYNASVQYCLAETAGEHCTVKISTPLLGTVLLCNLVKVLCLVCALLVRDFHPMATVGDLINSCLDDPDPHTHGQGPIAAEDVRRDRFCQNKLVSRIGQNKLVSRVEQSKLISRLLNDYKELYPKQFTSLSNYEQRWKKEVFRWYQASSKSSWAICVVLCISAWSSGAYLLASAIKAHQDIDAQTYTLSRMWQDGVGTVSTDSLVNSAPRGRSLLENVLLTNTPQLAITFVYICYNNCLTKMLLGQEYSGYARQRKPLRVSRPEGVQRSTYRLQLPYRYSIPLMTTMAVLHWLVARSIFLVQIKVFDYDGIELADSISACGYSAMAIVLSLFVSGILIVALLANGVRRLESGMPLASSCSLAVTAACHTGPGDEDARLLPLKYGVVISEESNSDSEYEHACFSSKEVTPLVEGHLYN